MYVKVENNEIVKYPYSVEQFRADHTDKSFPSNLTDDMLSEYGVYPVGYDSAPTFDPATERLVVSTTPSLKDGSWVITKSKVQLTTDQATSYTNTQATKMRKLRNEKLEQTDWCALSDVTMSAEMTTYRQALRDVPAQEGFPHTVTWPTKP